MDEWRQALDSLRGQGVTVARLTADSRRVVPGAVFAAYPGERADGRSYISQAVASGAAAVLWERESFDWDTRWRVPNAGLTALKRQVGHIADQVYGEPSTRLSVLGVTGTNGKTSVTQWLAQCLARLGKTAAVMGTIGNGLFGALTASRNTTTDAIELQEQLAAYVKAGAEFVAMEVSSHGLDQARVNGTRFRAALFTNLSRDHLDYHGTMQRYAEAKYRLFESPGLQSAVLNLDDPIGRAFAAKLAGSGVRLIGYGFSAAPAANVSMLHAADIALGPDGIAFDVRSPWGRARVRSGVVGRFNAANLLAVLGGLLASGVAFDRAVEAIAHVTPVAGRLERVGGGEKPLALVDYAHSPDGLEKALGAARELNGPGGKLICVFGCGGDRDRGKRPLMGEIAERLADVVILTSDNPRSEDPHAIIEEIRAGMRGPAQVVVDRAQAIAGAITCARAGDVVLIAGKGHEDYQDVAGTRAPFSDAAVARQALQA